jgi:hypothetical protein
MALPGQQTTSFNEPPPTPVPKDGGVWRFVDHPTLRVESDDSKSESLVPVELTRAHRLSLLKGRHQKMGSVQLPPSIQTTPCVSHVFRFSAGMSANNAVTVPTLLGSLGGICTVTNSKLVQFASSAMIRSVTIWPSPTGAGVDDCAIYWSTAAGSRVPDGAKSKILPEGITITTAIRSRPPRGSLAGTWFTNQDSFGLFHVVCGSGSIVDVAVNYRISNVLLPISTTIVSGVLGVPYYLALDGPSINNLTPVELPHTA